MPSKHTNHFGLSFNSSALKLWKYFPVSMVQGQLPFYLPHMQDFWWCCSCMAHDEKAHLLCVSFHTPSTCVAACRLLVHGMYRCLDVSATISLLPSSLSATRPFRITHIDVMHFKPQGKNSFARMCLCFLHVWCWFIIASIHKPWNHLDKLH